MTNPSSLPRDIGIPELIAELDRASRDEPCNLAFDGDGTLWSGDVSDDVFQVACRANWLLAEPIPLLMSIAHGLTISTEGTPGEMLWRFFEAEKTGVVEERLLFEIMTWCYAGRRVEELSDYADRALTAAGIASRIRWEYQPLLAWARAKGHHCWLVTASPWPIVRVVARRLGFGDESIIAARTREPKPGIVGTELLTPLPYREQKVLQLRDRRSLPRLLAAFGDSRFDLDMLRAAELAVAVCPKPALARELPTLPRAYVLSL